MEVFPPASETESPRRVAMLAYHDAQLLDISGPLQVFATASRLIARSPRAGAQPYESLPAWAKAFDVAFIPYRLNQQVRNANPLKLREYLATGKPVVSVPTPEIERFGDVVRIAPDREAFLAAIEAALADDSAEQRARRMASVRDMSWDHRVSETLLTVDQLLNARRAGQRIEALQT